MSHAVLLGDSIFDNGFYVSGGEPLVEQLRGRLPRDWKVTLLAVDGATISDVPRQLRKLPEDATHLLISVGGNDALLNAPILRSSEVGELLSELVIAQQEFRSQYRQMMRAVHNTSRPAVGCTVYDSVPGLGDVERMALSLFNDVILHELIAARMPVLDLRLVCTEARDYSSLSPIEPSELGGSKIALALQQILRNHDFSRAETVVYPGP